MSPNVPKCPQMSPNVPLSLSGVNCLTQCDQQCNSNLNLNLGTFVPIWEHLSPFGDICPHFETFVPIWGQQESNFVNQRIFCMYPTTYIMNCEALAVTEFFDIQHYSLMQIYIDAKNRSRSAVTQPQKYSNITQYIYIYKYCEAHNLLNTRFMTTVEIGSVYHLIQNSPIIHCCVHSK